MRTQATTYSPEQGLIIALGIFSTWMALLLLALSLDLAAQPWWIVPLVMAGMTFLYTGLFITAHDAMHGTVYPPKRAINNAIGAIALFAFALFWWPSTLRNHHLHHRHPGADDDPDFHDREPQRFWSWYFRFFRQYFRVLQLIGLAVVFNVLVHVLQVPEANALLFWALPPILSSLQLFYFGTYLPHRRSAGPFHDRHKARSNDWPVVVSFLTCYHFGYHWEHHASPQTPWWNLPRKRREMGARK